MSEEKISQFTFSDTGITVKLRKVSPMLASDIAEANPPPEPPEQEVDYGGKDGIVKEKNYQNPAYIKQINEHHRKISDMYNRLLIIRGVVEIEDDDWKKKVKEYRTLIKNETGKEVVEKNDLLIYIYNIAIGTKEDFVDLLNAITRRSFPNQEVVELAKQSFQG